MTRQRNRGDNMQSFSNQRVVHAAIWLSIALALHCAAAAMAQEAEEIWKNLDAHARKIHEATDISYTIRVVDRSRPEALEFVTKVWTKGEDRKWLRIDYPVLDGTVVSSVLTPKGGWHYNHGNKSIVEVSPSEIKSAAGAGKKALEDFVAKLPQVDMESINDKYRGLHELNATDSGDGILFVYHNTVTMHRVDLFVDRETGYLTKAIFYADGQNPTTETLIEDISSGEPDPEVFERPKVIKPFKPEFKPPENRWKPPVAGEIGKTVPAEGSAGGGDGTISTYPAPAESPNNEPADAASEVETPVRDPGSEALDPAGPPDVTEPQKPKAPTDLLGF